MERHCAAICKEEIIEGNIGELAKKLKCVRLSIESRINKDTNSLYKGKWKIVEAWVPEWRCYSRKTGELITTAPSADELSARMYYSHSWARAVRTLGNPFYTVTVFKKYTKDFIEAVRIYHDANRLSDGELDQIVREALYEFRKETV